MQNISQIFSRRLIGVLLAIVLLTLAVAPAPVFGQGGGLPSSARIDGIHHIYQLWNNCGPANLTMAMSYYGWSYGQEQAANWLKPNIEDKNVSPWQMAQYVNDQTELPIRALWRYGGTITMLKSFIAAGFPVIIESGFDVEDLGWMGHYETIVAYDDSSATFWVYDSYLGLGSGSGVTHSYAELDEWWRHFNRVFIVVFPTDREGDVRTLLGSYIDPKYAAESALAIARQEAAADQTDAWAWFNAGTSSVKLGRYSDAAIYFDEAIRQTLPWRMLWYQFGPYEAYFNVGRYDDMIALGNATLGNTEYVEETYYWIGMAQAALGQTQSALDNFDRVLSFNPNFTDAATARTNIETGAFHAPAPAQD